MIIGREIDGAKVGVLVSAEVESDDTGGGNIMHKPSRIRTMFEFSFVLYVVGDCAQLNESKQFRESGRVFVPELELGFVC